MQCRSRKTHALERRRSALTMWRTTRSVRYTRHRLRIGPLRTNLGWMTLTKTSCFPRLLSTRRLHIASSRMSMTLSQSLYQQCHCQRFRPAFRYIRIH